MSPHVDASEQASLRTWARGKALQLVTAALDAKPGEPAELLRDLFEEALPTIAQSPAAWQMLLLELCQVALLAIHTAAGATETTPEAFLQEFALALMTWPPST
jgi:hypothetical protein